jgi:transcriptional regulator with PAS, ATPase and Fis domain
VGKEVVANEIVSSSLRADRSFVKVNCGAIPENLIESELFGYEAGAFTGAAKNGKMGLFELANHGTILLDEIGELSLHLQVKLLRVLQDRCIQRVGGTQKKELDIRVIAATNADLKKKVEEGTFRGDLYYRLNVVAIEIPPLRQRKEDIPQLIRFYADKYSKKYNIDKEFSEDCIQHMMRYRWPGNIRELQNVVENLIIMTDGKKIGTDSLPERFRESSGELKFTAPLGQDQSLSLKDAVREVEIQIIRRTLDACGSTREAARILGVNQSTIVRKLQQAKSENGEET